MRQLIQRFLISTGLVVAAVVMLHSAAAHAQDQSAAVPPPVANTWRCHWDTSCGGKVGSGDVHGYLTAQEAKSAAMQEAYQWAAANCGMSGCSFSIGIPYQEIPAEAPGVELKDAEVKRVSTTDEWVVCYRCTSRNGHSLCTEASGPTFCAAYSSARDFVCEQMQNPYFGGACRCCYRVVKRPCCCCSSCCR
jgi:hypothetical protein